ncbi:MAG: glutathione peroxidase [Flavobacteriales bacterium]|nr:glutathione peroxidase [Flavobacteriales bacterium]
MKLLTRSFLLIAMGILTVSSYAQTESVYDIKINSLEGEALDLNDYKGKKLLIVNVASKCGYTPQYKDLQQLHEKYGDKVTILGVPCNQFMNQEPGTAEEIATFCERNYGVTFQLTEKVDVKGKDQHPLYEWLTDKSKNGLEDSTVKWNFQKYIISENGELEAVFGSKVNPMSEEITTYFE